MSPSVRAALGLSKGIAILHAATSQMRRGGRAGLVVETSAGRNCTNQTYEVAGTLTKVTGSDSRRHGRGTFSATLTHLRTSILGSCVVYSATVTGMIQLSF